MSFPYLVQLSRRDSEIHPGVWGSEKNGPEKWLIRQQYLFAHCPILFKSGTQYAVALLVSWLKPKTISETGGLK